jgi:hypothetical protein
MEELPGDYSQVEEMCIPGTKDIQDRAGSLDFAEDNPQKAGSLEPGVDNLNSESGFRDRRGMQGEIEALLMDLLPVSHSRARGG